MSIPYRPCILCGNRFSIKVMHKHREVFRCRNFRESIGKKVSEKGHNCFMCQTGGDIYESDFLRSHKMIFNCFKRHFWIKKKANCKENSTAIKSEKDLNGDCLQATNDPSPSSSFCKIEVKSDTTESLMEVEGPPHVAGDKPVHVRFRCPICSTFFKSSTILSQHISTAHIGKSRKVRSKKADKNPAKRLKEEIGAENLGSIESAEKVGPTEVKKRRKGIPKKKKRAVSSHIEDLSIKKSKVKVTAQVTTDADDVVTILEVRNNVHDNTNLVNVSTAQPRPDSHDSKSMNISDGNSQPDPNVVEKIIFTVSKSSQRLNFQRKTQVIQNEKKNRRFIQNWAEQRQKKMKSLSFAEIRSLQKSEKSKNVRQQRNRRKSTLDKPNFKISEEHGCYDCKKLRHLTAVERMERHQLVHCIALVVLKSLNNFCKVSSPVKEENCEKPEDLIDQENGGAMVCKICGKKSISFRLLKQHIKSEHTRSEHRCEQCNKSFKSKEKLNDHIDFVHVTKIQKCKFCNQKLDSKYSFKCHIKSVHNLTEFDYSKKSRGGKDISNMLSSSEATPKWSDVKCEDEKKPDLHKTSSDIQTTIEHAQLSLERSHDNLKDVNSINEMKPLNEADSGEEISLQFLEAFTMDVIATNESEISGFFEDLDLDQVDELTVTEVVDPTEDDQPEEMSHSINQAPTNKCEPSEDEPVADASFDVENEATEEELARQISLLMENQADLLAAIDGLGLDVVV